MPYIRVVNLVNAEAIPDKVKEDMLGLQLLVEPFPTFVIVGQPTVGSVDVLERYETIGEESYPVSLDQLLRETDRKRRQIAHEWLGGLDVTTFFFSIDSCKLIV